MLSLGMFSRLQVAMIARRVGLFSGSGPPAFTATAICLPNFNFVAFLYSKALPIGVCDLKVQMWAWVTMQIIKCADVLIPLFAILNIFCSNDMFFSFKIIRL